MPTTVSSNSQGETADRKNATSSKRKSGGTAGFTFVDQSADLRSIADKKIVDSDQRHLIRSHVMQKVRKDERLQGKKRPTGRDGARKGNSSIPVPGPITVISTSNSDHSQPSIAQINLNWIPSTGSTSPTSQAQDQQIIKVPKSPSQGKLDPFNTLPGGRETAKIVNELIQYCFHRFIPETFPIEANTPKEYEMWRLKVLQSQSANTATFFGMMATVAAHQAITSGRHKDLRPSASNQRPSDLLIDNDFAMMKSYALQATQTRIARNGWDGPTVEAIFSLIAAEHILGNFEEARTHLSALRKFFVDGKSFDPASPASDWIPLTDVKGAIGTMSRPLFRLPWNPEPMPQETLDKLYRWHAPEIANLGTAFGFVDGLGSQLQNILHQASVLCRFCQFNAMRSLDLTSDEYEMFRRKTLELEYDVLSYIYPGSPTDDDQIPNNVSGIEQIARLAILGITSSNITKVLPSLGVGRALTHFQNLAAQKYYVSLRRPPTKITAQFIVWALMIFAQCANKQPEERFFINSLAWYSQWAGIDSWTSLESICATFLYVPISQRRPWQEIWSKVCVIRRAGPASQHATQSAISSRTQSQQKMLLSQGNLGYT